MNLRINRDDIQFVFFASFYYRFSNALIFSKRRRWRSSAVNVAPRKPRPVHGPRCTVAPRGIGHPRSTLSRLLMVSFVLGYITLSWNLIRLALQVHDYWMNLELFVSV